MNPYICDPLSKKGPLRGLRRPLSRAARDDCRHHSLSATSARASHRSVTPSRGAAVERARFARSIGQRDGRRRTIW